MGQRESRANPLSYEEAVSRMSLDEMKRVRIAFRRTVGLNNLMTKNAFVREVFGDAFPSRIAEEFYELMGGGSKGISFKDLVSGLVLLTKGSPNERVQFLFSFFSGDGHWIQQCDMESLILSLEGGGQVPKPVRQLFTRSSTSGRVSYEVFRSWMSRNSSVLQMSRWLLDCSALQLTESGETPTYQKTIAEVTGLREQDIIDLEKRFYNLRLYCKGGEFNLTAMTSAVSPPIPETLCRGLFGAFDCNKDGLVDFKELCSALSTCCRGSNLDKWKFSFQVFDIDQDGRLSEEELTIMIDGCLQLRKDKEANGTEDEEGEEKVKQSIEEMVQELLEMSQATGERILTMEQYLKWAETSWLVDGFLDLMAEVCHLVLGLRPLSSQEEGRIVRKWMARSEKRGLQIGDTLYLVVMSWWKTWKQYVKYDVPVKIPLSKIPVSKSLSPTERESDGLALTSSHEPTDSKWTDKSVVSSTNWNTLPKHWKPGSEDKSVHVQTASLGSSSPSRSKSRHQSTSEKSLSDTTVHSVTGRYKKGRREVTLDSSAAGHHPGGGKHHKQAGRMVDGIVNPTSSNGRHRKLVNYQRIQPEQIDNSSLCEPETRKNFLMLTSEGGRLKKSVPLAQGIDFELLSEPVWRSLSEWYGFKICLPRSVIICPHTHKPELELYPQTFLVYRHVSQPQKSASNWAGVGLGFILGTSNNSSSGGNTNSGGNNTTGMEKTGASTKRALSYHAAFSKTMTVKQVFDYILGRLRVKAEDMRMWDMRDEANVVLMDEDDDRMLHELDLAENHKVLIETRNRDLSWPEELMSLVNSKGKEKRLFASGVNGVRGATGLSNLGNTCFMNSALQCMSNTQPLTQYFMKSYHLFDLNKTNPLGLHGRIAKRYGDLVQDLWGGESWNIAPLKMRWTIGRYSPRFNGFQQHDSQEFLAFLLDGLHEDLNRVHEKPYVELKDSNRRPDEEVAAEAWDNHLKRNMSVVVDLFQGQLRSQVVCQVCSHESVRFDPFTFLSLPLPMENLMYLEVIVIRLDGSVPVRYGLRLKTGDKYRQLRETLSELSGLDLSQLLLLELFAGTVRSIPNDAQKVRLLGGYLYAFEIPLYVYNVRESSTPESDALELEEPETDDLVDLVIDDAIVEEKPEENCEAQPDGGQKRQRAHSCLSEKQEVTKHPLTPVRGSDKTVATDRPPRPVATTSFTQAAPCSVYDKFVVAIHRKMIHTDAYLLAHQKSRPSLFGTPIIVPCMPSTSNRDLYKDVMKQVARLLSRKEPSRNSEQGETEEIQYPFILRTVQKDGLACSTCPWYRMCRGCTIDCNNNLQNLSAPYIAIDWDPKEMHLRYQMSQERMIEDHSSIEQNRKQDIEPINLDQCFEAFTKEEELGEEESWYCSKCKKHQTATKKMNIWKLPPVLIIHLKRFQFVNNRWAKSIKVVRFPVRDFDPSKYVFVPPTSTVTTKASPTAAQSTEIIQSPSLQRDHPPVLSEDRTRPKQASLADKEEKACIRLKNKGEDERNALIPKTEEVLKNWVVVDEVEENDDGDSSSLQLPGRAVRVSTESSVDQMVLSGGECDDGDQLPSHLKESTVESRIGHHYELYAISSHTGILGGGHYVTYAKNPNGKWYIYNDSSCKETMEQRIASESPYLLFYQRQDFTFNYQPERTQIVDVSHDDDDYNADARRFCVIQ